VQVIIVRWISEWFSETVEGTMTEFVNLGFHTVHDDIEDGTQDWPDRRNNEVLESSGEYDSDHNNFGSNHGDDLQSGGAWNFGTWTSNQGQPHAAIEEYGDHFFQHRGQRRHGHVSMPPSQLQLSSQLRSQQPERQRSEGDGQRHQNVLRGRTIQQWPMQEERATSRQHRYCMRSATVVEDEAPPAVAVGDLPSKTGLQ
jgi:hypothetical protein